MFAFDRYMDNKVIHRFFQGNAAMKRMASVSVKADPDKSGNSFRNERMQSDNSLIN